MVMVRAVPEVVKERVAGPAPSLSKTIWLVSSLKDRDVVAMDAPDKADQLTSVPSDLRKVPVEPSGNLVHRLAVAPTTMISPRVSPVIVGTRLILAPSSISTWFREIFR
jgi:hypothetical protein